MHREMHNFTHTHTHTHTHTRTHTHRREKKESESERNKSNNFHFQIHNYVPVYYLYEYINKYDNNINTCKLVLYTMVSRKIHRLT